MALFTMKISSCVAVVVLSMAHSSAQLVEGKKSAARLFGAHRELRGDCENLDAFFFDGDATKTCDDYVADKPNKRCQKKQPGTGKKVKFYCPATCKSQCKKTDSPTASPTVRGDCENLDAFRFKDDETKTCDFVAGKKKICKKKQPGTGGKKVKFFCPASCKSECKNTDSPTSSPTVTRGACTNLDSFQFKGDATQTCDSYVAEKPKKRCQKVQPGPNNKKLKFFCPATCKSKCKKTDSPTASPTAAPTATPTASPTGDPTSNPTTSPSVSSYPSLAPSDSPSDSAYPSPGPSDISFANTIPI